MSHYNFLIYLLYNMKKYLKLILTIEHPMGEIWLFLIGSVILFALRIISFDTAMSFIIPIGIFTILIILISCATFFWKNRKKRLIF